MAEEQELTPEEKLLKVIQRGDVGIQDGPGTLADTGGISFGDESDGEPVSHSSGGKAIGLGIFNRLFGLLVLVGLGLSGYEVYRNLPQPDREYGQQELDLSVNKSVLAVASMSDVLDMFDQRRIFGRPPERRPDDDKGDIIGLTGWRAYARDNLVFQGRSTVLVQKPGGGSRKVLEAIVMDTKAKKMHFLSVGKKVRIADKDVRVDKVEKDKVVLVYEEEVLEIGVPDSKIILH